MYQAGLVQCPNRKNPSSGPLFPASDPTTTQKSLVNPYKTMLSKHLSSLPRLGGPLAALSLWIWASLTFPDILLQRITNALMLLMIPLLIAAYYWWLPKIGAVLIGSAISQLPKVLSEQLGPALATAVEGLFQKVKMKGLSELGNAAKQNKAAILEVIGAGDPVARKLVKGLREENKDLADLLELGLMKLKQSNPNFNVSARVLDYTETTVAPRVLDWLDKKFPQIHVKENAEELKQLFKIQDLLPGGPDTAS